MARRSPMNSRYQKNQEPPGQTRKSAASAKPKRAMGVSSASTTAAKDKGKAESKGALFRATPTTPEYRALRKRWIILLVVAVVSIVAAALAQATLADWAYTSQVWMATTGLAYAALFYALYLDFFKMRPLRKAAEKAAKESKHSKKDSK
ncbi:MAG: hypothetical protein HGA39_02060 [Coriobacteriia bacterium]|nr:hypothetical protein [Coriobacteriia bacterium]